MRIDLAHDRTDHHPDNYVDPVVAKEGVFAVLEDGEMSEAERARTDLYAERAERKGKDSAHRDWTPKHILKRLTALYQKFTRPGRV